MKKITINEIAERAGVSKTTVSFYLNGKTNKMSEETQQRIQQIIDETGYEPSAVAQAMKTKTTGMLGVILDDVSHPYEAQALKGIEKTACEAGRQVLIGNSSLNFNSEKEYIKQMLKAGAEGFIIQSTYRFGMLASSLEKKQKPIVYLGTKPYDFRGRYVKSNHYDCAYQTITECVKKGYEEFLMISGDVTSVSVEFEKAQGYKDALQDANVEGSTCYIQENDHSAEVYQHLQAALDLKKKTLIYVTAPDLLPMVYQAIRKYPKYDSLMPETIGLVGYDLTGWTRMTTPTITAILEPAYQEGSRAAAELLELLEGKQKEGEVTFKNVIKWRESTM